MNQDVNLFSSYGAVDTAYCQGEQQICTILQKDLHTGRQGVPYLTHSLPTVVQGEDYIWIDEGHVLFQIVMNRGTNLYLIYVSLVNLVYGTIAHDFNNL